MVERASPVDVRLGTVLVPALVAVTIFVAVFVRVGSTTGYDTWGGLLIGAILFAATLPFLHRQAVREGDTRVFWILAAALLAKLAAAAVRNYLLIDIYGGVADAGRYHAAGMGIAENFRHGVFETGLATYTDTDFIRLFTGIVYTITGPTFMGGFVIYSWLAFIGLFLFYRAFTIAVPEGRSATYARWVFFLPTLLFWPSSIGKDAWMVFTLGIVAFGAARIFSGRTWRGLAVAGLGLLMAGMVRPHVAAIAAVALAAAGLLRRPRVELRELAPVARLVGLAALIAVAVVVAVLTNRWLQGSGLETETGVTEVLEDVSARTSQGGSEFTPSAFSPAGTFTVLYRPLLYEASNLQSALAAVETTFLLVFTIYRFRWVWAALKSMRRQPYVAFAIGYVLVFMVAFSGIANFGILARQRVQVLPFYVVLLSIPSAARRMAEHRRERDAAVA